MGCRNGANNTREEGSCVAAVLKIDADFNKSGEFSLDRWGWGTEGFVDAVRDSFVIPEDATIRTAAAGACSCRTASESLKIRRNRRMGT